MNSPSYDIRVATNTVLQGIIYDTDKTVKVYDEFADTSAIFPRIMLLDVSQGLSQKSKCGFAGDWVQNIKITDAMTGSRSKNRIELIVKEILLRLVPSSGPYIDLTPSFVVWDVSAVEQASSSYTDGVRQYIDKNIRITYSLTEI